jgi:hypothetical protein
MSLREDWRWHCLTVQYHRLFLSILLNNGRSNRAPTRGDVHGNVGHLDHLSSVTKQSSRLSRRTGYHDRRVRE